MFIRVKLHERIMYIISCKSAMAIANKQRMSKAMIQNPLAIQVSHMCLPTAAMSQTTANFYVFDFLASWFRHMRPSWWMQQRSFVLSSQTHDRIMYWMNLNDLTVFSCTSARKYSWYSWFSLLACILQLLHAATEILAVARFKVEI